MKGILSAMLRKSVLAVAYIAVAVGQLEAVDSANIKALFTSPPAEYSTVPFWVWNDMLTDELVISTLNDLAEQNIRQVFVHPRPGLMTPYLSKEWFRLWKIALKEAEHLDMRLWIYDENSYPSGFAGGLVPDAMPQSRGQSLYVREEKQPPKWSQEFIAVYRLTDDGYENVSEAIKSGAALGEASYLVAYVKLADTAPWFAGKYYVDLLRPGVTQKFLEITLEPYRSEFGTEFGKRIPGVFTDEPHLGPNWDNHWTPDLPDVFQKRWGYSLVEHIPSLFRPLGDWKQVRHNYHQLLLELFIDRWAKPYYDYCEKYGLEFTGHYWEHEWPKCNMVPDNMAMSAWQQRPGIDILMNQYAEGPHSQFGNVRSVKELSSIANQLDRSRTICEAYGAAGWELRFEDMKRIGDWLYVLGINTLNEHLSYISIRGARKRDHPQSFSYHQPWWQDYHIMASYFTRLSAVLSQGEQLNKVLVIEPTTTGWLYQPDPSYKKRLEKIGKEFQHLIVSLEKNQVEYDIGCEDIIARHGSVEGSLLKVGNRQYDTVVIPPLTENLNAATIDLLETYVKGGGNVLCCGQPPALIDGLPSDKGKTASTNTGWKLVKPGNVPTILLRQTKDGFAIRRCTNDKGLLFHHRRQLTDGEILFLVNTSIDSPTCGTIDSAMQEIEQWDAETGKISPYAFETTDGGIKVDFELAPCGSLLLFLSNQPGQKGLPAVSDGSRIPPSGPMNIRRIGPNVLTLDYVDITVGGQTTKNIYSYNASKLAFKTNGMEANPWDNAVQLRDELITKTFGEDSGFEATYRFVIKKEVPNPLYIVIERPDLYTITCNGKIVAAETCPPWRKGNWWLDKSFGKIDITAAAKIGDNAVTINGSPMTIYNEIEPAYLLGDFALKAVDSGFVITPEKALKSGRWNKQGLPFYSADVSYTQTFNISQTGDRHFVKLTDWYGSVAEIVVNGRTAGYIYHQPWECDVTEFITAGTNTIEVVVTGTLRNMLGPHHNNPPVGSTWPKMFQTAPETGPPPGKKYFNISCGLFRPFELHER